MRLFSCSFYNGYYFIIGFWVADLIRAIIEFCLNIIEKGKNNENKNEAEIDLLELICLNISDIFAGFLVLNTNYILSEIAKEKNEQCDKKKFERTYSENSIDLIYKETEIEIKGKFLIFLASVLDFFARSVFLIYSLIMIKGQENGYKKLKEWEIDFLILFDILSRVIFSKIFSKTKLYKHHFFSVIICIIGFIFMSTLDIFSISKNNSKNLIYLLFVLPKYILFPLEDVINESIFRKNFIFPQKLMFIRGILEFFIIFVLCLILVLSRKIEFNKFFIENNLSLQIIFRLFFIIVSFFRTFFLMKVIYLYNSQYVSFLIIVFSFINFWKSFFSPRDEDAENQILKIFQTIPLIIVFFGTLIYNEILIVNIWGLNENTKKNILIKEEIDRKQICQNSLLDINEEDEFDDEINKNDDKNDK